jgi:DNA-binding transcriptional MerR regulator/methylmalonyl-CoA mutase cobalamin-binding subunit
MEQQEYFPIRTVSTITGVNPVTLRAWERRYGLIMPTRTPKGHRLYCQKDIELINRIVRLLDRGISIGQAGHSLEKSVVEPAADRQQQASPWLAYQERVIDAIVRFDEIHLDTLYNQSLALYPIDIVTERLLIPVLITLGKRWESTAGSIAEEHFFGAFMRNKLGARFHHRHKRTDGKKLLVCCLPEEHHEIGVMLFSLAAHDHGYRIVYLGPNMPLRELAVTARHTGCDGIVLSGSITPDDALLTRELPRLVNSTVCPVFMGGASSVRCSTAIEQAGALPLGTDIRTSMKRIEQRLQGKQQFSEQAHQPGELSPQHKGDAP